MDFDAFVISGPSTDTISIGKALNGEVTNGATGTAYNFAGNCRTDMFTVSGGTEVPPLCGTLTGEHSKSFLTASYYYYPYPKIIYKLMIKSIIVYFDTTDDCHDLNFSFGQNAVTLRRQWNNYQKVFLGVT